MRQRAIGFGLLFLTIWLCSGQPGVRADVISFTEQSGFNFSQTDFAPGVNVGGNDPLTFNKFNPGSGHIPSNAVLQNVQVSFDWGFQSQLSAQFTANSNPAASIAINSFGGITLGKPDVNITGAGPGSGLFLFPTQTFQNTASFTSSTPGSFTTTPISTYFHSLPPGYVVPSQDQPLNLKDAGAPLVTNITPGSPDFAKFLGAGTVMFDVVATAGYNVPNTSGNATGTSLTYAFPQVTLTYTYSTIPEPPTLALMGIAVGGFFLARRFRRRRSTHRDALRF
jgi:hypothetical protein